MDIEEEYEQAYHEIQGDYIITESYSHLPRKSDSFDASLVELQGTTCHVVPEH